MGNVSCIIEIKSNNITINTTGFTSNKRIKNSNKVMPEKKQIKIESFENYCLNY